MTRSLPPMFLVLILALGSVPAMGQIYPDEELINRLGQIQTLLLNDQFDQGQAICSSLVDDYPDDPVGLLFSAAVMMARMTAAEENSYGDQFKELTDQIIVSCQSKIDDPSTEAKSSAWYSLWQGHAQAYRALWESRFGSFFQAIKRGLKAKSAYEAGLARDSANYDLWFGLGSYHYWKSAKAGLLKWLFIFKNQKDQGIEELRLASDSALIFASSARSALIWIYLNEEEYDSAITLAEEFRTNYPEGKTILWPLGESYFASGRYDQAILVYQEMRAKLLKHPGNYFNLIECDWLLCRTYLKLSDKESAREVALGHQEYLELIPKTTRSAKRSRLKYLKQRAR